MDGRSDHTFYGPAVVVTTTSAGQADPWNLAIKNLVNPGSLDPTARRWATTLKGLDNQVDPPDDDMIVSGCQRRDNPITGPNADSLERNRPGMHLSG